MIRGTGLRGLVGHRTVARRIVRPLLECSRRESARDELTRRHRTVARGQHQSRSGQSAQSAAARGSARCWNGTSIPRFAGVLARLAEHARADEICWPASGRCRHDHGAADSTGVGTVRLDASVRPCNFPVQLRAVLCNTPWRWRRAANVPDADEVAAVLAVLTGEAAAAEILGVRAEHSGGSVVLVHSGSASRLDLFGSISRFQAPSKPQTSRGCSKLKGPGAPSPERRQRIDSRSIPVADRGEGLEPAAGRAKS